MLVTVSIILLTLAAGIVIVIATVPFTAIGSSSKFFDEDGNVLYTDDRPPKNPDFAPDYNAYERIYTSYNL